MGKVTASDAQISRAPYFVVRDSQVRGETGVSVVSSAPSTAGPWAPDLQHGGPPNALAVASAERHVRDVLDRPGLVALRLASEFVGPVPVGELEVRTRAVRAARSAVLVEVAIAAAGRDCLHTRVWLVRDADTAAVAPALPEPVDVPLDGGGPGTEFPYGASLEWRFVRGSMREYGPGSTWARPTTPLLDDYAWTGLAHAALVADSASGVCAELDWDEWSFAERRSRHPPGAPDGRRLAVDGGRDAARRARVGAGPLDAVRCARRSRRGPADPGARPAPR